MRPTPRVSPPLQAPRAQLKTRDLESALNVALFKVPWISRDPPNSRNEKLMKIRKAVFVSCIYAPPLVLSASPR